MERSSGERSVITQANRIEGESGGRIRYGANVKLVQTPGVGAPREAARALLATAAHDPATGCWQVPADAIEELPRVVRAMDEGRPRGVTDKPERSTPAITMTEV